MGPQETWVCHLDQIARPSEGFLGKWNPNCLWRLTLEFVELRKITYELSRQEKQDTEVFELIRLFVTDDELLLERIS